MESQHNDKPVEFINVVFVYLDEGLSSNWWNSRHGIMIGITAVGMEVKGWNDGSLWNWSNGVYGLGVNEKDSRGNADGG